MIAETTILKPEGASDGASEMVEQLQPVEPVEKRSTDVDLPGEATKVVLTVGAAGANAVEAAVLVFTEAGHMLQCRSGYLLIIDS